MEKAGFSISRTGLHRVAVPEYGTMFGCQPTTRARAKPIASTTSRCRLEIISRRSRPGTRRAGSAGARLIRTFPRMCAVGSGAGSRCASATSKTRPILRSIIRMSRTVRLRRQQRLPVIPVDSKRQRVLSTATGRVTVPGSGRFPTPCWRSGRRARASGSAQQQRSKGNWITPLRHRRQA